MPLEVSKPGQAVGTYDLLEKIAEGGMGTVYKARQQGSGQIVALKIVPPHLTKNPVMLKRFEKEYNAARHINHPNIVRALDFGYHGGCPFLVMEYVEGESLGQRLERVKRLSEAEAVRIIAEVAQGLHHAHKRGMIHRDVKPDNILLTPDDQVKLTDMGLVKELEADLNLTRTGRGLGTPHFMAPEQFRNAKYADARCDIYSLAATLYMTVTGDLPFKSCGPLDAWMKKIHNELTPPRQVAPTLSERLDWAIRRAMSADPSHRPRNCREFVEDVTGQSTRKLTPITEKAPADVWYLIYKDEDGMVHTVKGSMGGIRRSLREGLLGDADQIRASRSKKGPFDLLRNHAEFRDLVVEPVPQNNGCQTSPPAAAASDLVPVSDLASSAFSTSLPPSSDSFVIPAPRRSPRSPPVTPAPTPFLQLDNHSGLADWLRWFAWLLVVMASGLGGYYLMPILMGLGFR
jgi:serine/threonine protein kinase